MGKTKRQDREPIKSVPQEGRWWFDGGRPQKTFATDESTLGCPAQSRGQKALAACPT